MQRRLLISAMAMCVAQRLLAQDEAGKPHRKVSANELRKALAARFPVRIALPGLIDVQVSAPQLLLLPERQRVGATVLANLADVQARRAYSCEMDWIFAVRYEAADRTLRALRLEIVGLRSPGMPPEAARTWRALLQDVARGVVGEIVLHRFSADELALSDALGLQPDRITVEDDGVEIWFAPKTGG